MSEHVGMSSCCLSGAVHDGKPTGRVETIGGLQCYVSAPNNDSNAKSIVFIVDSKRPHIPLLHIYTPLTPLATSLRMGVHQRPPFGR